MRGPCKLVRERSSRELRSFIHWVHRVQHGSDGGWRFLPSRPALRQPRQPSHATASLTKINGKSATVLRTHDKIRWHPLYVWTFSPSAIFNNHRIRSVAAEPQVELLWSHNTHSTGTCVRPLLCRRCKSQAMASLAASTWHTTGTYPWTLIMMHSVRIYSLRPCRGEQDLVYIYA